MPRTTRLAQACALAWAVGTTALHAEVVTSGTVVLTGPQGAVPVVSGATLDNPDQRLAVGGRRFVPGTGTFVYRSGTLDITAGSTGRVAYLDAWGDASTRVQLDGAGTRLELVAPGDTNRFGLGNVAGTASMVVSGGAVLDGAAQVERCDSGPACQNVVGAAAGAHGSLTVTGAGSQALFVRMFHVASMSYNGATGRAGENTLGSVSVLDGALLRTELASLGGIGSGPNLNGTERSQASVTVSGSGSVWQVAPSPFVGGSTRLQAALADRTTVQVQVLDGGLLQALPSAAGASTRLELGNGGSFEGTVQGAGSRIVVDGNDPGAVVRLASGGEALLRILDGGLLQASAGELRVGADGGSARLHVDAGAVSMGSGRIVLGADGILSGNGVFSAAEIVSAGLLSPGDSPGELHLGGTFRAQAGSRLLLEVQDNGHGGYDIDRVLFGDVPDLAGLAIEFSFLGQTDPRAFAASGQWDIDRFVLVDGQPLPDSAFDGVGFTARADAFRIDGFAYSAAGGARFSASGLPLPGSLALVAAALAAAAAGRRPRRLEATAAPV